MILSHRYKFIFLKTNKTAGTSVEIALSRFCGPDDIITPITAADEVIRKGRGYPGPQNFEYKPARNRPPGGNPAAWPGSFQAKLRFYNHIPAVTVIERAGRDVWDSYFKFCIERNPWDRAVSLYFWRYGSEPKLTFSEFLTREEPRALKHASSRQCGNYTHLLLT